MVQDLKIQQNLAKLQKAQTIGPIISSIQTPLKKRRKEKTSRRKQKERKCLFGSHTPMHTATTQNYPE